MPVTRSAPTPTARERLVLLAELAHIRAYEHRYEDWDSCAERVREIQAELNEENN